MQCEYSYRYSYYRKVMSEGVRIAEDDLELVGRLDFKIFSFVDDTVRTVRTRTEEEDDDDAMMDEWIGGLTDDACTVYRAVSTVRNKA